MNAKKLLVLILVFALGIGFGVAITNSAKPSLPPALYKSEVYFSPEGNVRANIVKAISEAKASIDLAIFDLTSEDIKTALEGAQKRGVKVRIIADKAVAILKELSLNARQEKIVRYLVLNEQIDNEQCQKICKSIKRTATRDLTALVEKDVLEKHGEKKGTFYVLSSKIAEKIRDIKGHA